MVTIFGIRNCTTMKKAFDWLAEHDVDAEFVDYKQPGVVSDYIDLWLSEAGQEVLLNPRGSTWRRLPEARKANLDAGALRALMIEFPTLIRRPILMRDATVLAIGFDPQTYTDKLAD